MSLGARGDVEDSHACDACAPRVLVPVAENLQGGADGEQRTTRVKSAGKPRGAAELVCGERLSGVLAAAERIDIEAVWNLLIQSNVDDLSVNAAPAGSLRQDQRVAAVPVGAQDLGHQNADAQRGGAHRVPSFRSSRTLKSRMAV